MMGVLVRCQRAEGRGQMSEGRVLLARPLAADASMRRGITLLEVLISIGVVAVGLLGVASLIPIGSFAVNETAKADRSAALGRAAIHEVRVREMLDRRRDDGSIRWLFARLNTVMTDAEPLRLYIIGQPFAIDPLFSCEASVQSGTGEYEYFPLRPTTKNVESRLCRLNLNIFEPAVTTDAEKLAVFNRIFNWQDDLLFDLDEDNPDNRPRQSCLWSNLSVAPYETPTAAGPNPLHAQSGNNYTWMLTAVPDPNELPNPYNLADLINLQQKTYEVSIITFYKRDFTCDETADPPSERFVEIQINPAGIGGGDAVLTAPVTDAQGAAMTESLAEEYLKIRENEWIMVTGLVSEPRFSPGVWRRIAKWYRVIRVDDEVQGSGPYTRNITLAGPDWDNSIIVAGTQPHATIITGAIGVYTTTVTVE